MEEQLGDYSRNRINHSTELNFSNLPDFALLSIMTFFVSPSGVDEVGFHAAQSLNKKMTLLANSTALWDVIPLQSASGKLNKGAFRLVKKKYHGTEGTCYHTYCRPLRRNYALKKARSYKDNEGIPYFFIRELAVLRNLYHANICEVSYVSVNDFSLHVMFPYIDLTLEAILSSPLSSCSSELERFRIPIQHVKPLLHQLVDGISHCHDRGILHRNLKPKHLLFRPGSSGERMIEGAKLMISDFALVRAVSPPKRALTLDVVTMWYRAPELFLGGPKYGGEVDMWSLGCIYGEMVKGCAIFPGLSEVDTLFQIFSKTGTPAANVFEGFPHWQREVFPDWRMNQLGGMFSELDDTALDLLKRMLDYNPTARITARETLCHSYFHDLPQQHQHNGEDSITTTTDSLASPPSPALASYTSTSIAPSSSTSSSSAAATAVAITVAAPHENGTLSSLSSSSSSSSTSSSSSSAAVVSNYFLNLLKIYCDYESSSNYIVTRTSNSSSSSSSSSTSLVITTSSLLQDDRHEILNWLVEFEEEVPDILSQRTLHLAMTIFDHYCAAEKHLESSTTTSGTATATRAQLFLVAGVALLIASKYEDVTFISVADIIRQFAVLDLTFEYMDVISMEETIARTLSFDFQIPLVLDYIGILEECELLRDEPFFFAKYLNEASYTISKQFSRTKLSVRAASVVSYALFCCGQPHWTDTVKLLSSDIDAVRACVKDIRIVHSALSNDVALHPYSHVYMKYSKPGNLSVALIPSTSQSLPLYS